MRVKIFTNTEKSQFRNVRDGVWQILGIPITVDDEVMNGVLYDKAENAKGLASYRDKPLILRHPEDEHGNGTLALSKHGIMNHICGAVIINTYNHNGVNYIDAEIKEKMMLAQDNGDYYINRLKEGLPIGVSTGLLFADNKESGTNSKGHQYFKRAINQEGDHVAMLPEGETPAGGSGTVIKFNGEDDVKEMAINIDEQIQYMKDNVFNVISELATNEAETSLLKRFVARCKQAFATNIVNCDNSEDIINNKGDAMRELAINALKAKGIAVNADATDAEVLAQYNEMTLNADGKKPNPFKKKSKSSDDEDEDDEDEAENKKAMNALVAKVDALSKLLAANSDKELDALAKQAAPLLGLDEAEAKVMGANALHKVLAKNGVVVGAPSAENFASNHEQKVDSINMKPWEAK